MGGIGYRLVHKCVDEISCRQHDGRNHLVLTKRVAAQDAADQGWGDESGRPALRPKTSLACAAFVTMKIVERTPKGSSTSG